MNDTRIGEGTAITLHFSLQLKDGSVVDTNFNDMPATFVFGDGNLLPGFEESLVGMRAGEKRKLNIPPEKGFGQPNPNNVHIIGRESFDSSLEFVEGLVVSFVNAAGGEVPGIVKYFDEKDVSVDFNHPLAGKVIIFDVHIISVEPLSTH